MDMPLFDRVREVFLQRLQESANEDGSNCFVNGLVALGFHRDEISNRIDVYEHLTASHDGFDCSQEFDGSLKTIHFMSHILRGSAPRNAAPMQNVFDEKSDIEFSWPLVDMAEFEFSGYGASHDLQNVIVLTGLPALKRDDYMFSLERLITNSIFKHIADVVDVYLPVDIKSGLLKGSGFLVAKNDCEAVNIAKAANHLFWPTVGLISDILNAPSNVKFER